MKIQTDIIKNKIVKGIKEYCDQNNFTDVMLGLSGGIDSAVVLSLACEALGPQNIHTFMLTTKYTSQKSIDLAASMAKINNVDHKEIDIQNMVDVSIDTLGFKIKNPVTEQNIQARQRGVLLMSYSNDNGWLVLACGNKSEAAMGYCTLYGDTCGGKSPIGDVYKTEVYDLARLINKQGKYPIPEGIITREPTAELATNQKDSDSLPEYELLDDILRRYIFGNNPKKEDDVEQVSKIKNQYKKMEFKRQQTPSAIIVQEECQNHM